MLVNELRKRAAASAALRQLAINKTAGLVMKGIGKAMAHPIVSTTGLIGGSVALNKGRKTWASFNPEAHKAMLGMS